MELTVGAVLEGKVKSITNFGAFISLPENQTGMVHISEIANTYVNDIHEHLTEGQDVKVMVIALDNGKINLSIKRLEPRPQRDSHSDRGSHNNNRQDGDFHGGHREFHGSRRDGDNFRRDSDFHGNRDFHGGRGDSRQNHRDHSAAPAAPKTADQLFEEKLKQFMTESDNKISSIRQYSDHRTKNRRR